MSEFEDGVDALGVAEDHARQVLDLEEAQARKLRKVYEQVSARLRGRLAQYPKDTFSAQQMRVTLLQLEAALQQFETELRDDTLLSARIMREKGTRDLVTEVNEFNDYFEGAVQPINMNATLAAMDDSKRLFNQYDVSVKTYSKSLRQRLSDNIASMQAERLTSEQMYTRMVEQDAIGKFFDGEEWRLRRIVRTELHGIYGQGKLDTLGKIVEDEPEMRKALYHPMDARTGEDSIFLANLDPHPRVDEPFVYTWQDRKRGRRYRRVFMAPPDRPNDRAVLIPYHPSWVG